MIKINYKAILVVVILQQILGMIWYNPNVFGNLWMESIGKTVEDFNLEDMSPFIFAIAHSFIMCWVMAYIFAEILVDTWQEALKYSTFIWLGFFASAYATHVAFGNFPHTLTLIDTGKEFISFNLAGIILGTWIKRR